MLGKMIPLATDPRNPTGLEASAWLRGTVRGTGATVTKIAVHLSPFSCLTPTIYSRCKKASNGDMLSLGWGGVGQSCTPHSCVRQADLVSILTPLLINRKHVNKFASPSLSFPLFSVGFSGNQVGQSEQRAWSGAGLWQAPRTVLVTAYRLGLRQDRRASVSSSVMGRVLKIS